MLSVDIKHKSRGGTAVIRGLSLTVAPGETLALVGPSGCGKTSAMRILAGLDDDFEGERRCPDGARLAMAFQEPRLLPWRSVRDNVALALPEQKRDAAKVTAALQATGVAEAGDLFPGQLSLGMARRVSLARALVTQPDYLLLDEPFVSLDEATAARMRGLSVELSGRTGSESGAGRAGVVLVTHDLREAAGLADRVLLLSPRPATVMREHRIDAPRARRDNDFIEDLRRRLLQPLP
jgi:sulfonate transport system ATP-binding protein